MDTHGLVYERGSAPWIKTIRIMQRFQVTVSLSEFGGTPIRSAVEPIGLIE